MTAEIYPEIPPSEDPNYRDPQELIKQIDNDDTKIAYGIPAFAGAVVLETGAVGNMVDAAIHFETTSVAGYGLLASAVCYSSVKYFKYLRRVQHHKVDAEREQEFNAIAARLDHEL